MTVTSNAPSRTIMPLANEVDALLSKLGVARSRYVGGTLAARSPITGEVTAHVHEIGADEDRKSVV